MTQHQGQFLTCADEALQLLIEGNERFQRGEVRISQFSTEILGELAKGQKPFATILGCSDSRVSPEIIFDAHLGQLFVIRVAGNVMSPEIAGTMQYAGVHLQTPLFVVLGHEQCGAVQAALDVKLRGVSYTLAKATEE
jgi:carbonic anhydrase